MTTPEEARLCQEAVVVAPPNLFVRACPGAGKTRTVVNRYLRVADEASVRGAAVISFTNRAADEVSRRCTEVGRPDLAQFPHFVGTFDRFIASYIVRPFGQLGGPVRIVDSWASLDVTIAGTGGRPVSLDHFEISPDGVLRFSPGPNDPALNATDRARREHTARARLQQLRNDGYLTCDDARDYALRLLKDHPRIASLLRARFAEIIVDEAQDCSASELELLGHLTAAGLPIVVVCDPHQSIYEWRDADPVRFAKFTADLDLIELNGNWRSSPAICSLAATLKSGAPDHPVGPHRANDTPIHVIRYRGSPGPSLGNRFLEVLIDLNLAAPDGLVLAHKARIAARAAGASFKTMEGNVAILAIAAFRLADSRTDPRKRQREFDRLQRLILRFVRAETIGRSTEQAAALAGVDPSWMRTSTLDLAQSLSTLVFDLPANDWLTSARQALQVIARTTDRETVAPGTFVRSPANSADKTIGQVIGAQTGSVALAHSSIHKAKGAEAPGVLVVIPPDRAPSTRSQDVLAAWEAGADLEAKRVLYVGVTRAEQVCALAIPDSLAGRMEALLQQCQVQISRSAV